MVKKEDEGEKDAEELSKELKQVSVSAFFERNRHLLGYDNLSKALLTVVKEACDNSLDATQEARILPEVDVKIKTISETRFLITVEDNGPGIPKEHLPRVFGSLLYGSKFHRLRQSRGIQGIGISAAVLYSQLTTGKAVKVWSKTSKDKKMQFYEMHIDVHKNQAEVKKEEALDTDKPHGVKIELEIEARYQKGKQGVDEYLRQTSITNPHLQLNYVNPDNEKIIFKRASNNLPKEPKEIKPHPHGTELGVLIRMLKETKSRNLQSFLTTEFCRIGSGTAKEIIVKALLNVNDKPQNLMHDRAEKLYKSMQEAKVIAPPTDCLSPICENDFLKSVQTEIKAEFYTSITRSPAVYRGYPFQIECCTGDSKIYLEDGQIVTIKEYVEKKMDQRVFSMSPSLKIVPTKVFMSHEFINKNKILKIKTRTGRELNLTTNNEIPILEDGNLIWKRVENCMAGDFVAVPRIMNVCGKIPHIFDLFDQDKIGVVDTKLVNSVLNKLKEIYGTYKSAAKILGINYEKFRSFKKKRIHRPRLSTLKKMIEFALLDYEGIKPKINSFRMVDTKSTNPIVIKNFDINEDLLYLLGLLNSDGYISRYNIVFVNLDQYLHKMYGEKIYNLFGLKVKRHNKMESYLSNKTLYLVLTKIREILSQLPDNLIVAWLKGIVDGDGWVSIKTTGIRGIGIATAKKPEAEFVQTMLLRLGIRSKIEFRKVPSSFGFIGRRRVATKAESYNIVINDWENIEKFYSMISFRQVNRANKLTRFIKKTREARSTSDLIPVGSLLKEFRQENKVYQYEVGFSDQTIRQVEKGNQNLTRRSLQTITANEGFVGESIQKLKSLAFSEILLDKIVDIQLVDHEEIVYDLTTEVGNFIANRIVMHNCALAYGGELNPEESIKVMRFANRVPLLYQHSACAVTEAIKETNWRAYGLQQSTGNLPVGSVVLAVHIASVWVPFTSEAKEAIAHYPEIIKEIKLAVQECGRRLGIYIRKNVKAREQREKANLFEKYIPELASSLSEITKENKNKLIEALNKRLKKDLPLLMEMNEEDKDKKIEGVVVQNKNEKQTTLK